MRLHDFIWSLSDEKPFIKGLSEVLALLIGHKLFTVAHILIFLTLALSVYKLLINIYNCRLTVQLLCRVI